MHLHLACNNKADITDREDFLLVISVLNFDMRLNLMTFPPIRDSEKEKLFLMGVAYHRYSFQAFLLAAMPIFHTQHIPRLSALLLSAPM